MLFAMILVKTKASKMCFNVRFTDISKAKVSLVKKIIN